MVINDKYYGNMNKEKVKNIIDDLRGLPIKWVKKVIKRKF
jgi:hypothetical protein